MSHQQIERSHQPARISGSRRRRDMKSGAGAIGGARRAVRMFGHSAMVQAYEVALMGSLVAKAPLRLIGTASDPADRRMQPVQAHAASRARAVLLVHGFLGTKSSLSLVARSLSARGVTVDTITYPPFGTSVEQLADRLVVAVGRMLSETGADKVHLVGHSLGGVVIAQAIAGGRLDGLVDTVVTLASPFGGSPWANLLPFGEIVQALRQGSPLLRRLASASPPDEVRWLAFTATLDIVVPGTRSVPAHAHVETITLRGVGHLGMLVSRQAVSRIIAALPASA